LDRVRATVETVEATPRLTVEEKPAQAPKKPGPPKGSKTKAGKEEFPPPASKNGDAPHDEEPAVVYDVTLKDENGQWNTGSLTSEYEAKNEYQEQLDMGERPVIIKVEVQTGRREILMKAPGAEVPEGDYFIGPR
jgi:hypothetical protein